MLDSQSNFEKVMIINFKKLSKRFNNIDDAEYYLKTNLILFEPNPKSEGFLTLLNDILSFDHCYCPTADPDFCEDDRFPEKEFKKMVKDIFIEMKERYP